MQRSVIIVGMLSIMLAVCAQSIVLAQDVQPTILRGSLIDQGLSSVAAEVDLPNTNGDIRQPIGDFLRYIISFVALIAVIAIIIAGIWLMVGMGSDESIQRGRKIILYVILGLVIIFFARVIVAFFTQELPDAFSGAGISVSKP